MTKFSDFKEPGEDDEDYLQEMANYDEDDTGVPGQIWIFPRTGRERHYARVKFYPGKITEGYISISISQTPELKEKTYEKHVSQKLINYAIEFVKTNYDVLFNYWSSQGETSSVKLAKMFVKVQK